MTDKRTGMRLHSEFEARVAAFLRERGYPEDSIVPEARVESKSGKRVFRPDFLIVDPQREERLAIIEAKAIDLGKSRCSVQDQLLGYSNALAEPATETFLVTPGVNGTDLAFHRLSEDGELEEFPASDFPRFPALIANKLAAGKKSVEQKQKEAADDFKQRCSWIAAIAFLLVVLDFFLDMKKMEVLNPERLTVLGAISLLLVVPYAAKLKVLGLEWERYNVRRKSDA